MQACCVDMRCVTFAPDACFRYGLKVVGLCYTSPLYSSFIGKEKCNIVEESVHTAVRFSHLKDPTGGRERFLHVEQAFSHR